MCKNKRKKDYPLYVGFRISNIQQYSNYYTDFFYLETEFWTLDISSQAKGTLFTTFPHAPCV